MITSCNNCQEKQGKIDTLKKRCRNYADSNNRRKFEQHQTEKFVKMLLDEGRTTKEELKKYYKKRASLTNGNQVKGGK